MLQRHSHCSNRLIEKRRGNRGMTLIELMVVVAIMGVVMTALYSLIIPVQQSTVAQTRVGDVQDNLRVALRAISKDARMAGLLIGGQPLIFEAPLTPDSDFTILTRSVQGVCARIERDGTDIRVSPASMISQFNDNDVVRVFDALEPAKNATGTLTVNGDGTLGFDFALPSFEQTVLVMVKLSAPTDPLEQKIRYRHDAANRALIRQVNGGNEQVLAQNVSDVNFTYETSEYGYYQQINIELEGKTIKLKDDVLSGEKTRTLKTSVTIRNSF